MRKRVFTWFIACFAIIGQGFAQAIPITPSTDTGAGATWYRIKNVRATQGGRDAYMAISDYGEAAILAGVGETIGADNFQWCFIGNNTNGFQIYNKALLADGARLIATGGAAKVEKSTTAWNYSWTFVSFGNYNALHPSNLPSGDDQMGYLHGSLNIQILFYRLDDMPGSGWIFEDATAPVTVDFSALTALIQQYSAQVTGDKANPAIAEKHAAAIAQFEAAIAGAQAIVDKGDQATQAEVNAAIMPLKIANNNYRVAFIDLPFTTSADTGNNAVWYRIRNIRAEGSGSVSYLSYDNGSLIMSNFNTTAENQLWAVTGDNVNGLHFYNKAHLANGAELNGNLVVTGEPWNSVWKLDKNDNNAYGIYDASGPYQTDFGFGTEQFIHGGLDGNTLFYQFGDSGSWWKFESTSTGIKNISDSKVNIVVQDGAIHVYGAKGSMIVTSLTGISVTVDANVPYQVGNAGVYVVKVNGRAHKVIVK